MKIDKGLQNSKYRLCRQRDESIDPIVNKRSILAQKEYKSIYEWERWSNGNYAKVWILAVLPNGMDTNQNPSRKMTHKILWDFEIQTDYLIPPKRPPLVQSAYYKKVGREKKKRKKRKEKRNYRVVDFHVTAIHRVKVKEGEKIDNHLNLDRKKTLENVDDSDTCRNLHTWIGQQRIGICTGTVESQGKYRHHSHNSIAEIGLNTEKGPDDPRRLAVPQPPVKRHCVKN